MNGFKQLIMSEARNFTSLRAQGRLCRHLRTLQLLTKGTGIYQTLFKSLEKKFEDNKLVFG